MSDAVDFKEQERTTARFESGNTTAGLPAVSDGFEDTPVAYYQACEDSFVAFAQESKIRYAVVLAMILFLARAGVVALFFSEALIVVGSLQFYAGLASLVAVGAFASYVTIRAFGSWSEDDAKFVCVIILGLIALFNVATCFPNLVLGTVFSATSLIPMGAGAAFVRLAVKVADSDSSK